jgi:hypothetical protein
MKIHGVTVSVNYADLLAQSIAGWAAGLESLTVITDKEDSETFELAAAYNANIAVTESFYADGAAFNKGRAQQEVWRFIPKHEWILLFDADIIPPMFWNVLLGELQPGFLYGAHRYDEHGARIPDDTHGYGYFQLFHGQDPLAQVDPFFDTWWTHAGNGDSTILLRWRDRGLLAPALPLTLLHVGGPSHNWYGRGKESEFERMQQERARRGGGWASLEGEKISRA